MLNESEISNKFLKNWKPSCKFKKFQAIIEFILTERHFSQVINIFGNDVKNVEDSTAGKNKRAFG